MAWIAGAVASVAGSLLSADAAGTASDAQVGAANNAADTNWRMFNTINQQQEPWRIAGQNALGAINSGFGFPGGGVQRGAPSIDYSSPAFQAIRNDVFSKYTRAAGLGDYTGDVTQFGQLSPEMRNKAYAEEEAAYNQQQMQQTGGDAVGGVNPGQFTHIFDRNDLANGLAPNYDFQLAQGQGAARNAANTQTGLLSGNTLRGINQFTQDYAGGAYQQAFNNYNAQQTNIFNRLSNIAGLGQTANQTSATAGTAAGTNIGNAQIAGGAAAASGIVGGANALTAGGNNALGWYTYGNLMNRGGSGGSSISPDSYLAMNQGDYGQNF